MCREGDGGVFLPLIREHSHRAQGSSDLASWLRRHRSASRPFVGYATRFLFMRRVPRRAATCALRSRSRQRWWNVHQRDRALDVAGRQPRIDPLREANDTSRHAHHGEGRLEARTRWDEE